jgi:excisionase family DNA binding protein
MTGAGDEIRAVWQGNYGDDLENSREKAIGVRAQCAMHMSPAQAAQVAGVSRWTIMRAIKAQDLQATRDNRNQWRISAESLKAWRTSTVRTPEESHTTHTQNLVSELRMKLAAETSRADVAEAMLARELEALNEVRADRDAWKQQATTLLSAPRKRRRWFIW